MKKLLFLTTLSFFFPSFASATVPSCQPITVSPSKTAYSPTETITFTVTGSSNTANIKSYWAPATQNLTADVWTEIPGNYNAAAKTWTGSWTPANNGVGNGEYIFTPNVENSANQFCSGNPGYTCSGCETGTEVGAGLVAGTSACSGCSKTIVINSNYSNVVNQTGYDMKKYWNFSPGYSWTYQGRNTYESTTRTFTTRIDAEEKVLLNNHLAQPLRYTKNNVWGYWLPKYSSADPNQGKLNLRFFLTAFAPNEPWKSSTLGALGWKSYRNESNPLSTLGPLCTGSLPPCYTSRTFDDRFLGNSYYAPYIFSESYLKDLWEIHKIERLHALNPLVSESWYIPETMYREWDIKYFPAIINTPAYSGPGLRFAQLESDFPGRGFWDIREDWYFAPNIGIVRVDEQNLLGKPTNDPLRDISQPLSNPGASFELSSYYLSGTPLPVSSDSTSTPQNQPFKIRVTAPKGPGWNSSSDNLFTGHIEVCANSLFCSSPIKAWSENGYALVDLSSLGSSSTPYPLYIRPLVLTTPSDTPNETPLGNPTQLPWSSPLSVTILPPASYSVYLPVINKNVSPGTPPGGPYQSYYTIQNDTPSTSATCNISFYNQEGQVVFARSLGTFTSSVSSYVLTDESDGNTSLPDNSRYSAVIDCNQAVTVTTNFSDSNYPNHEGGTVYNGFKTGDSLYTGTRLYAPGIYDNFYNYNTQLSLQNTTNSTASVTISYYPDGSSSASKTENVDIKPKAVVHLNHQNKFGTVNVGYSAKIESSQSLAALVTIYGTGPVSNQLYSYPAVTSGSKTLYAPLIMNNFIYDYGGGSFTSTFNSSLTLQNPGTATANYTVQYGSVSTKTGSLAAGSSIQLYTPTASGLPERSIVGAKITSDQPLIVLVNVSNNYDQADSYLPLPRTSTTVSLPIIMRNYYNFNTQVICQNTGSSPADITLQLTPYSYLGLNPSFVSASQIPPLGIAIFDQLTDSQLPTNVNYTATGRATSSQPLACIVIEDQNEPAYRGLKKDQFYTFTGKPILNESYLVVSTPTPSPIPTPVPGDMNGDRVVNATDYNLFLPEYGKISVYRASNVADFNNSGIVDLFDFNLLTKSLFKK